MEGALGEKLELLEELDEGRNAGASDRAVVLQPASCSCIGKERETKLPSELKDALAFADEKLDEIVLLTRAVSEGGAGIIR